MSVFLSNDAAVNDLITRDGYRILAIENERATAKRTPPLEGYAAFCNDRINILLEIIHRHTHLLENPELQNRKIFLIIDPANNHLNKLRHLLNNPL